MSYKDAEKQRRHQRDRYANDEKYREKVKERGREYYRSRHKLQRARLSVEQKALVLNLRSEGKSYQGIADETGLRKSSVSWIITKYKVTENLKNERVYQSH